MKLHGTRLARSHATRSVADGSTESSLASASSNNGRPYVVRKATRRLRPWLHGLSLESLVGIGNDGLVSTSRYEVSSRGLTVGWASSRRIPGSVEHHHTFEAWSIFGFVTEPEKHSR